MRLQTRNAEQVLLTMVIPLVLLVLGAKASSVVDLGPGRTIDIITPGILALAVLSTSFTSLAIATGFERRYGIIKRLGASPLPRWGLLFGKIGAVVIVEIVQLAILSGVGFALGSGAPRRSDGSGPVPADDRARHSRLRLPRTPDRRHAPRRGDPRRSQPGLCPAADRRRTPGAVEPLPRGCQPRAGVLAVRRARTGSARHFRGPRTFRLLHRRPADLDRVREPHGLENFQMGIAAWV
ncbi:hypothetical protein [Aeromicrobium sp. UC242_57]|uniref:hypothetical protein n=1 Tax=Aeromicrobium sp. UC242_57 TaxID=3374624 RepID=UPI0037A29452